MVLLTTAYFPPIEYLAAIANECRFNPGMTEVEPAVVYIEACEHYVKQSWRNRCRFYAADGAQTLNFPVRHEDFGKPISQMRIDWKTDWLTRHERAIISAYRTSPYFEYYQDELFAILDSRPELMLDFNTQILKFFLRKTGIPADIRFTSEWEAVTIEGHKVTDLREAIHPKRPNSILKDLGLERPYWQVFSPKYGFIPGLSIMTSSSTKAPTASAT